MKKLYKLSPTIILIAFQFFFSLILQANDGDVKTIYRLHSVTRFRENKGQVKDEYGNSRNDVLFSAIIANSPHSVHFTSTGFSYQIHKIEEYMIEDSTGMLLEEERKRSTIHYNRIDVEFVGANPQVKVRGIDAYTIREAFVSNGVNDIYDVRSFAGVMYENIYSGIDLIFYEKNNELKYDFIVHPGADVHAIRLRFKNYEPELIDGQSFIVKTPLGTVEESDLLGFISHFNDQIPVHIGYREIEKGVIGFELSETTMQRWQETGQDLIIDPPVRIWGAFFGGTGVDVFRECKYHELGTQRFLFMVGETSSSNGIATGGPYQGSFGGNVDMTLVIADPENGNILYATYWGLSNFESGDYIDAKGNKIAIFGRVSGSPFLNFTTFTPTVHQPTVSGTGTIRPVVGVFEINTTPTISLQLKWGSYVDPPNGGGFNDRPRGVAFDEFNSLYLVGHSTSNTPVNSNDGIISFANSPFSYVYCRRTFPNNSSNTDGFIVNLNATTGQGKWGTYLGLAHSGTIVEEVNGITTNKDRIYVVLTTANGTNSNSLDTIVTPGAYDVTGNGVSDIAVMCFDTSGYRRWGTLIGGNSHDVGSRITYVRNTSHYGQPVIVISGTTSSTNFPTINSFQSSIGGNSDAILAILDTSGANLLFSTYLGGISNESSNVMCYDTLIHAVYLAGSTNSNDLSTTPLTHQPTFAGGSSDGYIAGFKLANNFTISDAWITYYGSSLIDNILGITFDTLGSIYVSGSSNYSSTSSINNPISTLTSYGGGTYDGFYAKFCTGWNPDLPVTTQITPDPNVCQYDTLRFNASYTLHNATSVTSSFWIGPTPSNIFYTNNMIDSIVNVNYQHTGPYHIAIVGNNGEVGCASKRIDVRYTPQPYIQPDVPICEYNDITLNSNESGFVLYEWVGPNGFTSNNENPILSQVTLPQHDGNYTVTVTTQYGCKGSATGYIQVVDSANMYLTLDPIPGDSICNGSFFDLQVNGGLPTSIYQWSEPLFPNQSFVNGIQSNATTTYTVTVTDPAACYGTATRSVTVYSLDAAAANVALNIYPPNICFGSGDSVSVWVTGGDEWNSSYTWSDPTIYGDSGRVYYNSSQLLSVTVNNPLYCAGDLTVANYVQVVNGVSLAAFSNAPICSGNTLSLQVLTDGNPVIYLPDGNTFTGFNYNVSNATINNSGTYRVVSTNSSGCKDSVDVTVVVSNTAPVVYNSGPVCTGGTLQLFSGYGQSYQWTGPNGFTSNQQNPILSNVTTADAGVYTVVISGNGNCTGTGTTTVYVDFGLVNAEIQVLAASDPICDGQGVLLYVNSGNNYQWSNGANTQSIWVSNPGVTTVTNQNYSVTVTDISGCTNAQQNGTIQLTYMPPVPSAIVYPATVCQNDTLQICYDTNPLPPPYDDLIASFNTPYGSTSNTCITLPLAQPMHEGWYKLTMTDPQTGCYSMDSAFVDVVDFNASLQVTGTNCVGSTVSLEILNGNTTQWILPNGTTSTNNPLQLSSLAYADQGQYLVAVEDMNQCKDTLGYTLNVMQIQIDASSNSPVCKADQLTLSATQTNLQSYQWLGPNNFTANTPVVFINPVNQTHEGTYILVGTDANGCIDTAFVNVLLYPSFDPLLNPDFDSLMQNTSITINIIENDSNVINTGIQIVSGPFHGTVTLLNGQIIYTPQNDFAGWDSLQYINCDPLCVLNCDTAWVRILVKRKGIDINQLITPNDDGNNDNWVVGGIENYPNNKVTIMNRWGDVIYQANPYQNDWHGQSNTGLVIAGNKVTSGVYYYVIDLGNGDPVYKGYVVLEY